MHCVYYVHYMKSASLRGIGLMTEDAMCYATYDPTPTYYRVMGGGGGVH